MSKKVIGDGIGIILPDGIGKATDEGAEHSLSKSEIRRRTRTVKISKTLFRAIDILFSGSQNACPYVNKENSGTIECTKDVVYGADVPEVCSMDVYRVPSEELQPAVILIHGGGFSAGDKKYRKGEGQFWALNGFTVFCVNYGLAPDFVFPTPIKHLVNAANYIYHHADEFNIDADRIFVAGDSAGGYYSSMLAAFNGNHEYSRLFGAELDFKLFGALLNCGLYDMQVVFDTKYVFDVDDGVFLSFGGISKKDFDFFQYKDSCMPINFITPDFPPTFVVYSPNDMFCKGQGPALIEKLNESGVYCESYAARHKNSNHCFSLNWRGEDATAANELMMSFAKRLAAGKIKL